MENTQAQQLEKLRAMIWSEDIEMSKLGSMMIKEWWQTPGNQEYHDKLLKKEIAQFNEKSGAEDSDDA